MSIYDDPRAVDQMAAHAVAEERKQQAERARLIADAASAITKVADYQTKVALACLLSLIEQRMT